MSKKEKAAKVRRTSIGGQAVMEGVMMRGAASMAVSVRDSNGDVRTETTRIKPVKERSLFFRLPVVRGVVNFLSMLISGVQILTRSAEVYAEEDLAAIQKEKKEKREKKNKGGKKTEQAGMGAAMVFSVILGLALAIALFFILPTLITDKLFTGVFGWEFNPVVQNLIEGVVRFAIFLGYLLSVSAIKDICRTFMYHGAEHRVINCFERGLDMTVENAQSCSTVHNRCGTTFIFFVMLMSIIIFALFDGIVTQFGNGAFLDNVFLKILTKLALLPLVAGLSYELLKGLARTDFWLFWPLKAPGMLLQRITTKKPTDDMVEVALRSFEAVLKMDADPAIPPRPFRKTELTRNCHARIKLELGGESAAADADWIFCKALGCKRGGIFDRERLTISELEKIEAFAAERKTGKPLQYVLGETEFYGLPIKCDPRALIPRFETEILAEHAINAAQGRQTALDLGTGSGCVAAALAKKTRLAVTACDVSQDALALAAENFAANGVTVEVVQSDLFAAFSGRSFDLIVSNPPYVESGELAGLSREVRDFEPRRALDGGADGLDYYRAIAASAREHLTERGVLLLEVGAGQAERVAKLFPWGESRIRKDLDGVERVVEIAIGETDGRETQGN